ncbi:MAG TPA: hypothetical protein VMW25_04870, partial [Clostridia bacterium]|nr:hypothetical protein [Clostridia bacterium]
LALVLIYLLYNLSLVRERKTRMKKLHKPSKKKTSWLFGELFFWLAILVGSAQVIVRASGQLAQVIQIPLLLVGFFLLALGTTLPEMVVGLRAAERRASGILFGNALGSVVVNSTLVLGVVAMISPFKAERMNHLIVSGLFLLLAFLLLPYFLRSKKKLERHEGFFLGLIYLGFFLFEFWLK